MVFLISVDWVSNRNISRNYGNWEHKELKYYRKVAGICVWGFSRLLYYNLQISHGLTRISCFHLNIHNYFASYLKTGLSQPWVIEYGPWSDIVSIGGLYTAYGIRASYQYNYRLYQNTNSPPLLSCFLSILSVQQLVVDISLCGSLLHILLWHWPLPLQVHFAITDWQ